MNDSTEARVAAVARVVMAWELHAEEYEAGLPADDLLAGIRGELGEMLHARPGETVGTLLALIHLILGDLADARGQSVPRVTARVLNSWLARNAPDAEPFGLPGD